MCRCVLCCVVYLVMFVKALFIIVYACVCLVFVIVYELCL